MSVRIYFKFPEEQYQREVKTMYEDKTLVCKECGKEFVFTAGETGVLRRARFPERAANAASPAAMRARMLHAVRVSSSPLPVLLAAARLAFRSSRNLTVRYIAASASQRCVSSDIVTLKIIK